MICSSPHAHPHNKKKIKIERVALVKTKKTKRLGYFMVAKNKSNKVLAARLGSDFLIFMCRHYLNDFLSKYSPEVSSFSTVD